ncbi:hypothetical protein E2320_017061 [Naja naja]|nr:hypothetical protein E2320_017061 [Naja naja]
MVRGLPSLQPICGSPLGCALDTSARKKTGGEKFFLQTVVPVWALPCKRRRVEPHSERASGLQRIGISSLKVMDPKCSHRTCLPWAF